VKNSKRKYQSNCKSTQNALDTKPWKGCENKDLAAKKQSANQRVIAGGVTLLLPPFLAVNMPYFLRKNIFLKEKVFPDFEQPPYSTFDFWVTQTSIFDGDVQQFFHDFPMIIP
jgi:hypothetical protein